MHAVRIIGNTFYMFTLVVGDGFLCKNSNNLVIGANPCIFFLDRLWALSSLLFIWLSNLQQSGERKKTTDNCIENRKKAVLAKTGLSSVQKNWACWKGVGWRPKISGQFPSLAAAIISCFWPGRPRLIWGQAGRVGKKTAKKGGPVIRGRC